MDENPVNLFPPLRGAGRLIVHFFITSLWSHNERKKNNGHNTLFREYF
jgi:hypothetical protein